jgi:HEAT repeat protein
MARSTPQARAGDAVARFGVTAVVDACVEVLDTGLPIEGDVAAALFADPHPEGELARTTPPKVDQSYWWPTWALRTMLHLEPGSLGPDAERAVMTSLGHRHWRPREMAAKVVVVHEIGRAADALAGLLADETPRVRVAALRGLAVAGEHEHLDDVTDALDDPEPTVSGQAVRTLAALRKRLDLPDDPG